MVCIIFTLWSKLVIAKAPNLIVAQASLLAGSNLVRRLREESVNSEAETNIWHEEVSAWDGERSISRILERKHLRRGGELILE